MDDTFTDLAGDLDHPMLIVTAAGAGEISGCLVGFATQCSIDPPRFLVCVSDKNHTFRVAMAADHLAVHVLGPGHHGLARLFGEESGDEVDKFAGIAWSRGPGGAPILADCDRWFVGRVLDRVPLGDHVGHVLEPVAVQAGGTRGQLGFQAVRDLDPGHDA
jgi:flavin reductase (DIM6/NTAB) family NADH-FMN oxidoreductase RutF